MKIYTKTGDKGLTGLIGGKRIPKSDNRIIAYGSVDELNSYIGLSLSLLSKYNTSLSTTLFSDIITTLSRIQNELFVVGSDLADPDLSKSSLRVQSSMVTVLENEIDNYEKELSPITYFILPGGSIESSSLHIARSIARRAETNVAKLSSEDTTAMVNDLVLVYLNRLSDLLFVLSRTINKRLQITDIAWKS